MSFEIVYKLRKFLENLGQEYNGYPLRCIPSPYDPRDYRYLDLVGSTAAESAVTIDYRIKLPPVFDQGPRGSCVACAATWTIKAYEEMQQEDYPQNGLSASFLYSMCKKNDGMPSEEGTQPKVAVQILQKYGVCPEDVMPYTTLTQLSAPEVPEIPNAAIKAADNFKIKTYAQLCSAYDISRNQIIETMRKALRNEGPFMLALLVCENFEPDKNHMLPLPQGQIRGGHAVGIAGDLPDKQCFILRNSWGTAWGDSGYAYLPYEWLTKKMGMTWCVFEAWTATDITSSNKASRIVITPGAKSINIDGQRVSLNQPVIKNKFPIIKLIAENMGYNVKWDRNKIIITRLT